MSEYAFTLVLFLLAGAAFTILAALVILDRLTSPRDAAPIDDTPDETWCDCHDCRRLVQAVAALLDDDATSEQIEHADFLLWSIEQGSER